MAGISKAQIGELKEHEVPTTRNLATLPIPLPWKPERGSSHSLSRVREQARIQIEARDSGEKRFEVLPIETGLGLTCLPEPSAGDVFLDIEGDPFVGEHGIEYLFGYSFTGENGDPQYCGEWALSRAQEKQSFERFIDFVVARLSVYPDLHVYHFAPYEPAALKRLMGRYATCEDEIDRMLRAGLFVDLYRVVKNGVRASVESYSIKKLEPFYSFDRATPLADANRAIGVLQANLELEDISSIPDGAGKTFTSARMICELVRCGKRVGVTANSHKVIRNVVDATIRAANELGIDLNCCLKADETEDDQPRLVFADSNEDLFQSLGDRSQVGGGTAWLWARPDAFEVLDVLFVDEAAQMSLANVLAVSQAAKTVVLVGDPQQLDQPTQGTHPDGCDGSALHHILGDSQTISPEHGLFLEETWRLHPSICNFTSEAFYSGKLRPKDDLAKQTILSQGRITGSGLRYISVPHTGNQSSSTEEADVVAALVGEILESGSRWIDREGAERVITLDDVLVITPYNAQVFELQRRLPEARVGTVDKFQGQEAPIAIYSMASSSHADAPRGMEFLYSLNRFNVATSRAKCLSILVSSPLLFEAECRTPRQMQLANAFCRYLEMAVAL